LKEWTGIEIERARQELEQATATVLGRMLFEYSRLDMNLGLMLVRINDSATLEAMTEQVSKPYFSFGEKLNLTNKLVQEKFKSNIVALAEYEKWIESANAIRELRNVLVHGRWGVEATKNRVVNVVGIPTGEQKVSCYTIAELKILLQRMQDLGRQLSKLREQHPI
jgi:predicted transport protein